MSNQKVPPYILEKKSKAEHYLDSKSNVPSISALMVNKVSDYRKVTLGEEVEKGLYREGTSQPQKGGYPTVMSSSRTKTAAIVGGGSSYKGSGDSIQQMPEIYSPLWLTSNMNMPRDLTTINAWLRAFFALNPFVNNAISLHSTYPISKLNIKCANKDVENFFNDMIEKIDLMNICVQIAQEYWLLGEAFPYAEYDENNGTWSDIKIQNPDYIVLKRTVSQKNPIIMLRPDEGLKRVVFSNKPGDIEQKKQLGSYIVDAVKRGQNIPLHNYNISHLARRISPYEVRGTGLPTCVFRQLMLFDQLRESKFAQAQGFINGLTVVKVGSADGLKPTFEDIQAYRNAFEAVQGDKDAKIFTHDSLTVDRVGFNGTIIDTSADITQLMKEIFIGLQVPSVLMDGGADTTYANGGVALDALRQRYMQFRNMMSSWLRNKIFAPISIVQEFFEIKNGVKRPIVPEVDWNHMSLFDSGDYIQNLITLTQGEGEQKRASLHSLYKSLGLEWEDEIRKQKKEQIQSVIAKKEKAALEAMDLTALRTINEDEDAEIIEPTPKEGEAPGGGGLPGEKPMDLPGMDSSMPPPPPPGPPPPPPV